MSDPGALLLRRLSGSVDVEDAAVRPRDPGRNFDGVDLGPAVLEGRGRAGGDVPGWWDPVTARAHFSRADLQGCSLRSANLSGLSCDGINLAGADLINATLVGARLGGGVFDAALLEDADLGGAHLRFASFRQTVLEGARLRQADLHGASLNGAQLGGADLHGANLQEADLQDVDAREANLSGARLVLADLRGADLRGADLRDCALRGARLDGADLRNANLEHVDLSRCSIQGILLADAHLERTRLLRTQLGETSGEELRGEYELARRSYLALERNFLETGDPDAASWAYRRRRRAQKLDSRHAARHALRDGRWWKAGRHLLRYGTDKAVELVCDYGESVPRVLLTMLAVFVAFLLWYGVTGSILRLGSAGGDAIVTRTPLDLLRYTLLAMLAPGSAPDGMAPSGPIAQVVTLLQSFASIFLIGLLGFVAGNRIRR